VGVSSSQIRNWCTQFAGHLSADANPAPGQPRTLTNADVATLQRVAELRADGVPYPEIPSKLESIDGELVPYIDATPTDQPNQPAAIELYTIVESRLAHLQGQIDRLQAAQAQEEQSRLSAVTLLGIGVIAGILLVAVVLGLFAFGAWVGG
jgi:uncharacterized small protein (DUF1192 family)